MEHIEFVRRQEETPLSDVSPDVSLRPETFADYPGQSDVCRNLKVYIESALKRGKLLDHTLLHGPPGLGKTTLAGIIARALSAPLKITSGPVLDKTSDLMGVLAGLDAGTVLFIDEIHRMPANVEEVLYKAMEDQRLDILVGQGPSTRTVEVPLMGFTLIGATTRAGSLSRPLRERFGIVEHLKYYEPEELCTILRRSAHLLGATLNPDAAFELACRSRGTPRVANHLLRRVIDHAVVGGVNPITRDVVLLALQRRGIDQEGLDGKDREFLNIILERYEGGPVGLDAVAAALNEERSTLEDVYEPYLIYRGFLARSPRGRVLTPKGCAHLRQVAESGWGSDNA
jgi:Holliday junction DNA helicase RuvB